jgi:hypothetical protein
MLPFMLFSYIPFTVISLNTSYLDENDVPTLTNIAEFMEYLMLIYLVYSINMEWKKFQNPEAIKYSIWPLLNNILISLAILYTIIFTWSEADKAKRTNILENLRDIYVLGLLTQTAMLLYYVRVLPGAATFVRALFQVIIASIPLLAFLFFMLMTEATIYYVLINQDGLVNTDNQISFLDSLRLSYFATLGDFTILENADSANA